MAIQIEQDAYNDYGAAHLSNDKEQSEKVLVGTVFAALFSVVLLLGVMLA